VAKRGARQAVTFDTVRAFALTLPGTEAATMYGAPAVKAHGRLLACMATNKAAEPNTLVVCIDFAERDELIAEAPDIYYLKDHYVDYASVLVRLSRIQPDALRDLLLGAHRFVSAKRARKRPARRTKVARHD
jgi:hypothetical protein